MGQTCRAERLQLCASAHERAGIRQLQTRIVRPPAYCATRLHAAGVTGGYAGLAPCSGHFVYRKTGELPLNDLRTACECHRSSGVE